MPKSHESLILAKTMGQTLSKVLEFFKETQTPRFDDLPLITDLRERLGRAEIGVLCLTVVSIHILHFFSYRGLALFLLALTLWLPVPTKTLRKSAL